MKESDLHNQVAELFVVRASGHAFDSQRQYPKWELENSKLKRLLGEGIGGVILVGANVNELAERSRTLKSWSEKTLFLCADVEEGLGQRFKGGTWLMPPLAVGQIHRKDPQKAIELAEKYGVCTGAQARVSGLNWVLAPVCDINTNFTNPVINMRAWGEDPFTVSSLTTAFNRGLASQLVLSCAKHFPGHGDTCVDSHLELPILDHDLNRLDEVEFRPFKDLIASGVDAVMSAHILLPKIDSKFPASLSSKIVNLLRENLRFDGLLVTDALVMQPIIKSYGAGEAAVLAFEAGADVLMMPQNPDVAIKAICDALLTGRISLNRLEEALFRRKKALNRISDLNASSQIKDRDINFFEIENGDDYFLSKELIVNSTIVNNPVFLENNHSGINLLRVDSVLPCPFLTADSPACLIPQQAGYNTIISHQSGITPWQDNLEKPLALDRFGEGPFFIQLFIRGNPFCGNLNDQEPWIAAIRQLQRDKRLSGIVVYGSPYLWDKLIQVIDCDILSGYSPGQMQDAQDYVLSSLFKCKNSAIDLSLKSQSKFTD